MSSRLSNLHNPSNSPLRKCFLQKVCNLQVKQEFGTKDQTDQLKKSSLVLRMGGAVQDQLLNCKNSCHRFWDLATSDAIFQTATE